MSETRSTTQVLWLLIRQDDNGNRYRVGTYATRAEAEKMAKSLDGQRLDGHGAGKLYNVERLGLNGAS
jgi:hypothetical protein